MTPTTRTSAATLVLFSLLTALALVAPSARGQSAPLATVMIPTSDGVELAAQVILPEEGKAFPVLLNMTPYGPGTYFSSYTDEGYVHVNVDIRGTGDPGASFVSFASASSRTSTTWSSGSPIRSGAMAR